MRYRAKLVVTSSATLLANPYWCQEINGVGVDHKGHQPFRLWSWSYGATRRTVGPDTATEHVILLLHFPFILPPRFLPSVVICFFPQFLKFLPCIAAVMYWTSCPSPLFLYFQRLYLYLFQLFYRNTDLLIISNVLCIDVV